ncbi:MAG: ThuA domain-containing protein [Fimbriimonadaceae bacterium]|nr:ThuA domain-containing protein [Fimbriimonadaceae bacterium]
MNRRTLLQVLSAAVATGTAGRGLAAPAQRRLLFFTKSAGFEHSVVKRQGGALSWAEQHLTEFGQRQGWQVTCSKDGSLFTAAGLAAYDAFVFYTTGDLTKEGTDKQPPLPADGKQLLLDAVAAGKGFIGIHTATDTFHSKGGRAAHNTADLDPYIAMVGGEFIGHGKQQPSRMRLVSPQFPGTAGLGDGFDLLDEWYTFKNSAADQHVILVQQTAGMEGPQYQRPDFPATWARRHGQGRVFYTSMGHREDVWDHATFQAILLGGIGWALGDLAAETPANVATASPGHRTLATW